MHPVISKYNASETRLKTVSKYWNIERVIWGFELSEGTDHELLTRLVPKLLWPIRPVISGNRTDNENTSVPAIFILAELGRTQKTHFMGLSSSHFKRQINILSLTKNVFSPHCTLKNDACSVNNHLFAVTPSLLFNVWLHLKWNL